MYRKFRPVIIVALVAMLTLLILPPSHALALCGATDTIGNDDIVVCSNPPDTDGVDTNSGNDHITVLADTTVSATITNTIDSGYGNDVIDNFGTIRARMDAINTHNGNDVINNRGKIESSEDGVVCAPGVDRICTLNNSGSIYAAFEPVDIIGEGGKFVLNNEGTLYSTEQEAIHVHGGPVVEITNTASGRMDGWRNSLEVWDAGLTLNNAGVIHSRGQTGLVTAAYPDVITNTGTISSAADPAVFLGDGNNTLTNRGTLKTRLNDAAEVVVMTGNHDDTIINSGSIIDEGAGAYAIYASSGNDTLIIEGGTINKPVHGAGGSDALVFRFAGDQAEVDAFTALISTQLPVSGSAAWRGSVYTWLDFEAIRLEMTVTGVPATPPPTATVLPTTEPTQPPTAIPTTAVPTAIPTTAVPTAIPTTAVPTAMPTTAVPTVIPTTAVPTAIPTTAVPTSTPTPIPTTVPPTATCPTAKPNGVTARSIAVKGNASVDVVWENVSADACAMVTRYDVVFRSPSGAEQRWSFTPAQASCASTCRASIRIKDLRIIPTTWRVEAYNVLGTGGSDNTMAIKLK